MLKEIWERASVRRYKPDPVPADALQEILRAAMHAPTANNARPWHIVVVTDPTAREKLGKVHQWAAFCAESPVVLAFCGDPAKSEHWWIEDCSAATENAMIQAAALGLGTCWVGIRGSDERGYDREDTVRKVLGIPDAIRVLCLFSLGFPAGTGNNQGPGPMDHVHREKW